MNDQKNNLLKQVRYFNMEKYIAIIVMLMIILLIGLNILRMYSDYIIVQHSETSMFDNIGSTLSSYGAMEIAIEESKVYPMLEVIINGEPLDDKFDKNNEIKIKVYDGDVIQLNGSMYNDNITVRIKNMSLNINNALSIEQITIERNIHTLAIIRM